jgi:Contractile injection system tube protein
MSFGGLTGELAKLYINSHDDEEQKSAAKIFSVYYNPTTFVATYGITYNDKKKIAESNGELPFNVYNPVTYTFDLMFDGTGASQPSGAPPSGTVVDGKLDVDSAIKEFMDLCYGFDGTIHRPRFLSLIWGETMQARVLLTGVTVTKDLFSSDGKTLRAKLACSFKGFSDKALADAEKRKSSPDMTHARVVLQGDKLPLMCESIYGKPDLYLQVARYNNLSNYRNLKPGQKIFFPPLVTSK